MLPAESITDSFYQLVRLDVFIARILGLFLFVRTEDGRYVTKYRSFELLYFFAVYSVINYFCYRTAVEITTDFQAKKTPGIFVLFVLLFAHPLPLLLILESGKINHFFASWLEYQINFRSLTKRRLHFPGRRLKIFMLSLKFFLLLFPPTFMVFLFPWVGLPMQIFVWYYVGVSAFLTSLWYFMVYYLYCTAVVIQDLVMMVLKKKMVRMSPEMSLTDLEVLWVGLSRMAKLTGRSFSLTYSYYILWMFLEVIVITYESLMSFALPVTFKIVTLSILTVFWIVHTASIPFTSHLAVKKIGEDLQKTLLDFRMKGNPVCDRRAVDDFLDAISDNQPVIDLGGFVTLDNSLITSLMSTLVTYLIVLVQFKV